MQLLSVGKGIKICMMYLHEASVNCKLWRISNYDLNVSLEAFIKRFINSENTVCNIQIIAWRCITPCNTSEELLLLWGHLLAAGSRRGSGSREMCWHIFQHTMLQQCYVVSLTDCEFIGPDLLKTLEKCEEPKGKARKKQRAVCRGNFSHTAIKQHFDTGYGMYSTMTCSQF